MLAYIVTTIIGIFAIDENKKIISFKPFPKYSAQIAERLRVADSSKLEETKALKEELSAKGYTVEGAKPDSQIYDFIKSNLRKLAIEYNFVKTYSEFNKLLAEINIKLSKDAIKKATSRDNLILHSINAIEELDKATNIFVERLREFYSLHFPELNKAVSNNEKFAKLVEQFGKREKFENSEFKHLSENSMGIYFKDEDIETLQSLAHEITQLYKFREKLSGYLENLMTEEATNFSELATPSLAAKLIAKAGGLQKLSMMASSTIQLLGAEKALFRFLHSKGKSRSPRFGLLYNHPFLQATPEKLKGKIARILAAKLSIAAKTDFYTKRYIADKLKKELNDKIKEIIDSR